MFLEKLNLINFKNYSESELLFTEKINCFLGNNGVGKTNLLDAIYYLSFCKSFLNPIDSQNVNHDADFFVLQGLINKDDIRDNVFCSFKRNASKVVKLNNKEYSRFSDHIGLFPLVIISPSDNMLIYSGSEDRRKFFDGVLSQFDNDYLASLIKYNKIIAQRNSFLKQIKSSANVDFSIKEIWDEQIVILANNIHKKRKIFVESFIPIIKEYHNFISDGFEQIELIYESQLNNTDFAQLLKDSEQRDLVMQYTTVGIHKDDFLFKINGNPIRRFGSQGQQKSFVIALKLAQFNYLKKVKGYNPFLLLDDIFDKLDSNRTNKIVSLVSNNSFGQVFITDANTAHSKNIFDNFKNHSSVFEIKDGNITLN